MQPEERHLLLYTTNGPLHYLPCGVAAQSERNGALVLDGTKFRRTAASVRYQYLVAPSISSCSGNQPSNPSEPHGGLLTSGSSRMTLEAMDFEQPQQHIVTDRIPRAPR